MQIKLYYEFYHGTWSPVSAEATVFTDMSVAESVHNRTNDTLDTTSCNKSVICPQIATTAVAITTTTTTTTTATTTATTTTATTTTTIHYCC